MGVMTDEEIYRKHADDLVRFATGLVGPFDAQDVVTDACLRSFRAREWPGVRNHRAYLYRSVLNQARSHHRSTLRRRVRELRAAVADTTAPVEVDVDVPEDALEALTSALGAATEKAKELGLEPGAQFVVMGEGDVVILKKIEAPDRREFLALARKVRGQARKAGVKRSDIKKAVRASRRRG